MTAPAAPGGDGTITPAVPEGGAVTAPAVRGDQGLTAAGPPEAERRALDAYSELVVGVAERLAPSVANLRVTRQVRGGRVRAGEGSGVVLTPDGFLLTSAHVVAGADGGRATFPDGRELRFTIIGSDPLCDLAVLRCEGEDLAAATLGDAEDLRVGQLVVAIGNPHGLGGSLTTGVVSAVDRSLPAGSGRAVRMIDNVIHRRRAEPRELGRRAGRQHRPGGGHQHRGGRRGPRPGGAH